MKESKLHFHKNINKNSTVILQRTIFGKTHYSYKYASIHLWLRIRNIPPAFLHKEFYITYYFWHKMSELLRGTFTFSETRTNALHGTSNITTQTRHLASSRRSFEQKRDELRT